MRPEEPKTLRSALEQWGGRMALERFSARVGIEPSIVRELAANAAYGLTVYQRPGLWVIEVSKPPKTKAPKAPKTKAAKPPKTKAVKPPKTKAVKPPKTTKAPKAPKPPKTKAPTDFASEVMAAALLAPGFGSKAWIAAVWQRLGHLGLSLDQFKQELIKAAIRREIRLSRMDLTAAIQGQDVFLMKESETPFGATWFHLIDRREDYWTTPKAEASRAPKPPKPPRTPKAPKALVLAQKILDREIVLANNEERAVLYQALKKINSFPAEQYTEALPLRSKILAQLQACDETTAWKHQPPQPCEIRKLKLPYN